MYRHIKKFLPTFLLWRRTAADWPLPPAAAKVKKIIFTGMGGSAQAASIAAGLAFDSAKVPLELCRDYRLPAHIDRETLVVAVSYSGTTEETISGFKQARKSGAKLLAIGTGGEMAKLAAGYKVPYWRHDYRSQPRAALGVHLALVLNLLERLGHYSLSEDELAGLTELGEYAEQYWSAAIPEKENEAKRLARNLSGRVPVIIGAGTLAAVANRFKAHLNENAKSPAYFEVLPEMNHNSLVGTSPPSAVKKSLYFLLLDSRFGVPHNRGRLLLTERLYQEKGFSATRLEFIGQTPFLECMAAIHFGDYLSFYLALLYGVDPTETDIIAVFKNKLAHEIS